MIQIAGSSMVDVTIKKTRHPAQKARNDVAVKGLARPVRRRGWKLGNVEVGKFGKEYTRWAPSPVISRGP